MTSLPEALCHGWIGLKAEDLVVIYARKGLSPARIAEQLRACHLERSREWVKAIVHRAQVHGFLGESPSGWRTPERGAANPAADGDQRRREAAA